LDGDQDATQVLASILVVDDDDAVRQSLRLVLETQGYRVTEFSDGVSFVGTFGWQTARCVVLDLNLPGMSGLEVLRSMRACGGGTPVIVMTGAIGHATAACVHRLGADHIFEKPVEAKALLAAIAALTGSARLVAPRAE
jgi:two-component system response regulator FixJ